MASDTKTDSKKTSTTNEMRSRLGQVIEVAFTLVAVVLVLGAVLVAFRDNINTSNPLVELVINIAETFDGPLSRNGGIFEFSGRSRITQEALANWGLAALLYLVVGRLLGKIVRP